MILVSLVITVLFVSHWIVMYSWMILIQVVMLNTDGQIGWNTILDRVWLQNYRLSNCIDISDRESINTTLCEFPNIVRDIADPLFKRHVFVISRHSS